MIDQAAFGRLVTMAHQGRSIWQILDRCRWCGRFMGRARDGAICLVCDQAGATPCTES